MKNNLPRSNSSSCVRHICPRCEMQSIWGFICDVTIMEFIHKGYLIFKSFCYNNPLAMNAKLPNNGIAIIPCTRPSEQY